MKKVRIGDKVNVVTPSGRREPAKLLAINPAHGQALVDWVLAGGQAWVWTSDLRAHR